MPDQPVSFQDVVAWIRESLADYQGLYDVQDLTFVKSTVRVVTPRRDALFDVARDRWRELADPSSRPALTEDLRLWASRNLVRH
jgi:hypothetical protein